MAVKIRPLFHSNFEGVFVRSDRQCWGQPGHLL